MSVDHGNTSAKRRAKGGRAKLLSLLTALVLAPAGSLGWGSSALHAQGGQTTPGAASGLSGNWANVASDGGRAEIERGVDQGIEDMFSLVKPTARSRLRDANPPIPTLEAELSETLIRVNLGHGRNTSAAPGTWQPGHSATGDPVRIRYTLTPGGVLKMESVSDGGSARHTFRVSGEDSLQYEARIESSRLPKYVRYTLQFRRMP